MPEPLLRATGLHVRRGTREVVRGVTLALEPGDAMALVGPNAAGKSTLVRALAGLLPPSAGRVELLGRPLASWSRTALARAVALVGAAAEAAPPLRVRDSVALGRYPHRGPFRPLGAADRDAVARALAATGVEDLAERPLDQLSAGERQLASLARALAQEPRVLLLDEPSAHLDVRHQLDLFRVLDAVARQGVAVLAVVHDLGRAAAWARRMAVLAEGHVVAEGPPAEVLVDPACASAFGVRIVAHVVPGGPFYAFHAP